MFDLLKSYADEADANNEGYGIIEEALIEKNRQLEPVAESDE